MIYAWNHMSMPSRASTSFLRHGDTLLREFWQVSMPSRAYASFLHRVMDVSNVKALDVSMPSRAYASFLLGRIETVTVELITVSMPSRAYASFLPMRKVLKAIVSPCVNALTGLCLISTFVRDVDCSVQTPVCQCPHGLMPHFYSTPSKT